MIGHTTMYSFSQLNNPADNNMFKVNKRNTRTRCEICSKLTIKIPEQRQCRGSGIFIVNFEHISHLVSIVNFEQVNAGWVRAVKAILSYVMLSLD